MNNNITLEDIKRKDGAENMLIKFEDILKMNKRKASILLNDNNLSFSTFFIFIPIIKKSNLINILNLRNKIAIKTYNELFSQNNMHINYTKSNEMNVFKWMIKSASYDDGIDDDFDKIIDYAIAKLINDFKDTDTLKKAIDLAFIRNGKNEFNHDLVWSIFKSNNSEALKIIAEHLNSANKKEISFSKELLKSATNGEVIDNNDNAYDNYVNWISENQPYLNFTGDGYNLATSPTFCKVNSESKYMCKPVMSNEKDYNQPKTQVELNNIKEFKKLDEMAQKKLGKISKNLHDKDINSWQKWKNQDLFKQLESAYMVKETNY